MIFFNESITLCNLFSFTFTLNEMRENSFSAIVFSTLVCFTNFCKAKQISKFKFSQCNHPTISETFCFLRKNSKFQNLTLVRFTYLQKAKQIAKFKLTNSNIVIFVRFTKHHILFSLRENSKFV